MSQSWPPLPRDTGWVAVTSFLNGWSATVPVYYRVLNGVVFWRGVLSGGSTGPCMNIPDRAQPDPASAGSLHWLTNELGSTTAGARITAWGLTQFHATAGQNPTLAGIIYPAV